MTYRHGGCLCGAIRYELKTAPAMTVLCHCTHCQRQSGAAYSTNLGVPEGEYVITGEPKVYIDKGDTGGTVDRHFCGTCGSPILSRASAYPGMAFFKAFTLDDRTGLDPKMEIYTDHAAPWVAPVAGAQRFSQGL